MDINTQQVQSTVAQVASEYAAAEAARGEQEAAEAALLERIISMVGPALPAISSRQVIEYRCRQGEDGVRLRSKDRALRVEGGPEDVREHRDASSGTTSGAALMLLSDGTWERWTYEGSWSIWQDSTSHYAVTRRPLTTLEVARKYDLDDVLETILKALDAAKGTRATATRAAQERATKLRALLALL